MANLDTNYKKHFSEKVTELNAVKEESVGGVHVVGTDNYNQLDTIIVNSSTNDLPQVGTYELSTDIKRHFSKIEKGMANCSENLRTAFDLPRLATAEGYDITIENDSITSVPVIKSFSQYGECVQDGTPTPEAPIAITGKVAGASVYRKNLADVSNPIPYYVDGSGAAIYMQTRRSVVIPVSCGATYTISQSVLTNFMRYSGLSTDIITNGTPLLPICEGETVVNNYTGTGTTFTITNDKVKYLFVSYWTNSSTASEEEARNSLQIELGSTATAYEPHIEPQQMTVTDSDGNPVTLYGIGDVRDTLVDNGDGTGSVTHNFATVDLGTLSWSRLSSGVFYAAVPNGRIMFESSSTPSVCSAFKCQGKSGMPMENIYALGNSYIGSNKCFFAVICSAYTTSAEFKAAMSGVMLYFQLATPTTETVNISGNMTPNVPTTKFVSDAYTSINYYEDDIMIYNKLNLQTGDVLTDAALNYIEDGVRTISQQEEDLQASLTDMTQVKSDLVDVLHTKGFVDATTDMTFDELIALVAQI